MRNQAFFNESREQSVVKATIVAKYFWAWAKVIMATVKKRPNGRIAYIDLFAGPGRYQDGTKSTPLMILERAIVDPDMARMLVSVFNDVNADHSQSLEREIEQLPGVSRLRHKPVVWNAEVGERIVKGFERRNLDPTLFFVDPWGYKGLSLRLVNSVLKDWGCDCLFFFNYNRISMGVSNPVVRQHMDALFGERRSALLRERVEQIDSASDRELAVVEELASALRELGGKYVLPFRFRDERGSRTSHHLIFVSKNFLGYEIMKGIMAKESSTADQGVASFEYSPADERFPTLFELTRPLDELAVLLVKQFAGESLSMKRIYEIHNVGTRYIAKNYKAALARLEQEGRIVASPPVGKRPKGTFADHVLVTFPPAR